MKLNLKIDGENQTMIYVVSEIKKIGSKNSQFFAVIIFVIHNLTSSDKLFIINHLQ